jgi:rhodanese-related sulfurtransferase
MRDETPIPTIDARTADARLHAGEEPAPILLDVREPPEFIGGRAVGATLVPLSTLGPRIGELPRDRPLFVICHSGERSGMVTGYLLANGWTDVCNVAGGMIAWEHHGLPTRRGAPEPAELELPG